MKRVLVFFPHNLFPARTGAHRRCLQLVKGLHELGAEVSFASSTYTSDIPWAPVSQQSLRESGISHLYLHQKSIWDSRYVRYSSKLYQRLRRPPPLASANYAPPGLRRWFRQLALNTRADIIVVTYAFWSRLVTPSMHRTVTSVIDTQDLVSLYKPRFMLMEQYLATPPFSPAQVEQKFLREDFFDTFNFQVAPEEYRIYDAFRYTVAITPAEAGLISQNVHNTRVLAIPMTQPVVELDNRYDGAALYTPGRNPFNVQGYLYFAARVLPSVLAQDATFCLQVTGGMCEDVLPADGISLRGFVSDLTSYYQHAPFLICPILGKTGQQVKIVEAMAHGVPVIATRAAAEGSPIRHGENGLVADNAEEFSAHVLRLWQDRALCKRLAAAARETIANEFSQARLLDGLSKILEKP